MPSLSKLFGHTSARLMLQRALESGNLPGTYLFAGNNGVGKGALAQAFAQAAACLNPKREPFDSCGVCVSCREALRGHNPEIVTLSPAGEQMQIWQFWDRDNHPPGVLTHTLPYAPSLGKKRVYIIERAEALNESAANSLLKVLEEPPEYALFILLAAHTARVLPTIVSRCQTVRLFASPIEELGEYLKSSLGVEANRAESLAAYAEGRVGQAIRMAQHPEVGAEIERILDFAEGLPVAPRVRALRLAEQLRKLSGQVKALSGEDSAAESEKSGSEEGAKERVGRRQLATIFDILIAFYRDLLTLSVGGEAMKRVVNRDRLTKLSLLAQEGSPERWISCLDSILLARRWLDANANIAMLTETLTMRLLR